MSKRLAKAIAAAKREVKRWPEWARSLDPHGKRESYEQLVDGKGTTIKNGKMFYLRCCDCGLTHRVVVVTDKLRKGTLLGLAVERESGKDRKRNG